MHHEDAARLAAEGNRIFEALKRDWYKLGIAGSPYSPDFLACLLLGNARGVTAELVASLKAGAETLAALKRDERVRRVFMNGNEAAVALVLARLAELSLPAVFPPVSVPQAQADSKALAAAAQERQVSSCPHCDHSFAACAEGAYRREFLSPAKPAEICPSAPSITSCPHCSHAFDACARGAYAEREAQVAGGSCVHVDAGGQCVLCTSEETIECIMQGCDQTMIAAKAKRCKNCEEAFCEDCAGEQISEYGYCGDCQTLSCDGCNEDVEAGTERACKKEGCGSEKKFCETCEEYLLGEGGACSACLGEEEYSCSGCDRLATNSRLTDCKNVADCGHTYCKDCKDGLSKHGYCDDCKTIPCEGCENDVEAGTERHCAAKDCGSNLRLCEECAKNLLNAEGRCGECSGEEERECSGCGGKALASRMSECRNFSACGNVYCVPCAETLSPSRSCKECGD